MSLGCYKKEKKYMKHIFLIHSNTVLLSALGAIEYEGIPRKDILFLYSRHFSSTIVDNDIQVIDISDMFDLSNERDFVYNYSKHSKIIRLADQLICNFTKDKYIAYVPHFTLPIFTVFISNRQCIATCLLQEGAFSFFGKPTEKVKTWVKNALFSSNRIWWLTTWDMPKRWEKHIKLKKTYAIDTAFFSPLCAENIIIKWPHIDNEKLIFPENTNFFIFESAVEQSFLSIEQYVECCNKLIEDSGVTKCYLKFHPAQTEAHKKEIEKLFDNIDYELFDNSIPFELVLCSSKNLNLYGFSTSLLKFGKNLGHHVTSYLDMMCSASPKFKTHIEQGNYSI